MLFPYTYIPHQIEKMQEFIDFIFYKVWCKAPTSEQFSLDLFKENADLHEVLAAFYISQAKGAEAFCTYIESIYTLFKHLDILQINQLKKWYHSNNNLERMCANDAARSLARYTDVAKLNEKLSEQFAAFFKGLYSQSLLDLAALREKIGDIDDHYQNFVITNKEGKCPFCGIADLQGPYHSTREAYDHYFPKALYPFNSINFRNLVPACHHCNSSYKTSKDPAYTPKDPAGGQKRRAVFYPYEVSQNAIEIAVTIKPSFQSQLTPEDIEFQFGPPALSEKIETWKDIYGIEERYKAKCCHKNDGKYWLMQLMDEWREKNRLPEDYLETLAGTTQKYPYAECNFLKLAFLKGCDDIGLFHEKVTS